MPTLFRVTQIDWDCDDEAPTAAARAECAAALGLPSIAYVYVDDEDEIADALSDEFNWCIKSSHAEEADTGSVFASTES